jgi:hypothetical protein
LLVEQAIANQIKFDYILADNWFESTDNMKFIHYEVKKMFIMDMKTNRLIDLSLEDKKKDQYQNLNTFEPKDEEKGLSGLRIFPFLYGSTGVLYLVTNDLDSDADHIYTVYKKSGE